MTATARARKAPARKVAPQPLVRLGELRLAAGLTVLVLAAAVLSRPGAPPKPETAAPFATLQVPAADRARIDSWPKFFACYDLTSPQAVMTATLRAADFAHHPKWRADAMIQVPLAAPALAPTPAESAVLLDAAKLAQQRAVASADPCAGAETPQLNRHPGSDEADNRDRQKRPASSWRARLSSLRRLFSGRPKDETTTQSGPRAAPRVREGGR